MQKVKRYKLPEKPQHLGLKIKSIPRKESKELNLYTVQQVHPVNGSGQERKPFLHPFFHTFFHLKNPSPMLDFK